MKNMLSTSTNPSSTALIYPNLNTPTWNYDH